MWYNIGREKVIPITLFRVGLKIFCVGAMERLHGTRVRGKSAELLTNKFPDFLNRAGVISITQNWFDLERRSDQKIVTDSHRRSHLIFS